MVQQLNKLILKWDIEGKVSTKRGRVLTLQVFRAKVAIQTLSVTYIQVQIKCTAPKTDTTHFTYHTRQHSLCNTH